MTREDLTMLQGLIDKLRDVSDDYLIVSVGVRGPNLDCPDGNAVATVRMGSDEATSEALYLIDAISLARGKIIRERKGREEKRKKDKAQ